MCLGFEPRAAGRNPHHFFFTNCISQNRPKSHKILGILHKNICLWEFSRMVQSGHTVSLAVDNLVTLEASPWTMNSFLYFSFLKKMSFCIKCSRACLTLVFCTNVLFIYLRIGKLKAKTDNGSYPKTLSSIMPSAGQNNAKGTLFSKWNICVKTLPKGSFRRVRKMDVIYAMRAKISK